MMGQCIGRHQGEIEELKLIFYDSPVTLSIGGLVRRLKVIESDGYKGLSSQHISELSGIVADCDALEEFRYNLSHSTDDFKAIFCQLVSKFPSLRLVANAGLWNTVELNEESRFVAFLVMVKSSKTIE